MSGVNRLEGKLAEKANKLLPKIAKLLEKSNIPYCLDGGTLLGIVRENRLLPWDNDLDLFVRGVDAKKIRSLKWELLLIGCRLIEKKIDYRCGPIPKDAPRIFKIKCFRKYGGQKLCIDMILKYDDKEYYHWAVGINPHVHKKVPRNYYDNFDTVVYNNKIYPIPINVEKYLEYRYGDWKTQKETWDYRKDDQAKT